MWSKLLKNLGNITNYNSQVDSNGRNSGKEFPRTTSSAKTLVGLITTAGVIIGGTYLVIDGCIKLFSKPMPTAQGKINVKHFNK